MAIDQESLSKVRSYAESLKGQERTEFISKFKSLKNEESIATLASRLPDTSAKEPSLADKAMKTVVEPAQEIARGFGYQGADMLANLDALTKAGTAITGIPRSGTFGEMAKAGYEASNAIPETNLAPLDKNMYQTVGRVPGMALEFSAVGTGLKTMRAPQAFTRVFGDIPAVGAMTNSMTMAVQSAVNEYRQSEDFVKSANSASTGAFVGAVLDPRAMGEALKIGKMLGKTASKAFLKGVTGDEKFAEAFVNDPWKFNLNPFGKVKALKDVEADNVAKMDSIKREYEDKFVYLDGQNADKKRVLNSELDNNYFNLKEKNKEIKVSLANKSNMDVEKVNLDSRKSFDDTVNLINVGLHDDVSNAVAKVELLKESAGKKVGQAVDNIIEKDMTSGISKNKYLLKFEEVLKKNDFIIDQGRVIPKFGAGSVDDETNIFLQKTLQEIKDIHDGNYLTLGYAQAKKRLWQEAGYAGQDNKSRIMQQLSGALNPVNMADDIVGKNIAPELQALKSSNKEFSEMIPKYEEAIKNFSRMDATGKPIADPQKVLNAIKKRDLPTLKQMYKADSLLPEKDRLIPKAMESAKKLSEAESIRLSHVKIAKRKANEQINELRNKISEKEFKFRQANKEEKYGYAKELKTSLDKMKSVELPKLEKTISDLKNEVEFTRQQELARSFTAPGGRKAIQGAALLNTVGNSVANPGWALASGAATVGLSPKVASGTVKTGARMAGGTAELLKAVADLSNKAMARLY